MDGRDVANILAGPNRPYQCLSELVNIIFGEKPERGKTETAIVLASRKQLFLRASPADFDRKYKVSPSQLHLCIAARGENAMDTDVQIGSKLFQIHMYA